MQIHIVFDSAAPPPCSHCAQAIEADMLIYGVGSPVFLQVFHPACAPKEKR